MDTAPETAEYVRLHITPFSPELLTAVIPPSLSSSARNISYHRLQNFPEKSFGYVELPAEGAQRLKKKLNGTILKGSKMQVADARTLVDSTRFEEVLAEDPRPAERLSRESRADRKLKRKWAGEVIEGAELRDRKIKRGWTDNAPVKRSDRKSKSKEDKKKEKERVKSKYTTGEECLFKTAVPPNKAGLIKEKRDKQDKVAKEAVVIHEFQKTVKHATFLRSAVATGKGSGAVYFEDGKGWVDEDGVVVEEFKRPNRIVIEKTNAPVNEPVSGDESSSSSDGESSDEGNDLTGVATDAVMKDISDASDVHEDTPSTDEVDADVEADESSEEETSARNSGTIVAESVAAKNLHPKLISVDANDQSDSANSDSNSSDDDSGIVFKTDVLTISASRDSPGVESSKSEDDSAAEEDEVTDEEEEVVYNSKVMTILQLQKAAEAAKKVDISSTAQSSADEGVAVAISEGDVGDASSTSDSSLDSSSDSDPEPDLAMTAETGVTAAASSTPPRPVSTAAVPTLSLTIPPTPPSVNTASQTVHPLEALYKRRKGESKTSAPAISSFSFFGDNDDPEDDLEDDEGDKPPMTPFTAADASFRGIRSAAPTPDTAHPSRFPSQSYFSSKEQEYVPPPRIVPITQSNNSNWEVKAAPAAKTFISGKLPPGSIDFSGKNTKKTFADDDVADDTSYKMPYEASYKAPQKSTHQPPQQSYYGEEAEEQQPYKTGSKKSHQAPYQDDYTRGNYHEQEESGTAYNANYTEIKNNRYTPREEARAVSHHQQTTRGEENIFYAEERKVDEDDAAGTKKEQEGTDPNQDFSKWFYENRGGADRAWKKRRKAVAKEGRQRGNRKRGEQRT